MADFEDEAFRRTIAGHPDYDMPGEPCPATLAEANMLARLEVDFLRRYVECGEAKNAAAEEVAASPHGLWSSPLGDLCAEFKILCEIRDTFGDGSWVRSVTGRD